MKKKQFSTFDDPVQDLTWREREILSLLALRQSNKEIGEKYNIAILQPNIDPYNDKFGGLSHSEQLDILLNLADSITDENTDYVVGPETAFDNSIWINNLEANSSIRTVQEFVKNRPKINFIVGIDCRKKYTAGQAQICSSRTEP